MIELHFFFKFYEHPNFGFSMLILLAFRIFRKFLILASVTHSINKINKTLLKTTDKNSFERNRDPKIKEIVNDTLMGNVNTLTYKFSQFL